MAYRVAPRSPKEVLSLLMGSSCCIHQSQQPYARRFDALHALGKASLNTRYISLHAKCEGSQALHQPVAMCPCLLVSRGRARC